MDAWKKITSNVIQKSSEGCALNLSTDGSEDDMIHYFKKDQPCKTGKEILAFQLSILSEKDENPLTDIDDEDSDMTVPVFMSVDSNQQRGEYQPMQV